MSARCTAEVFARYPGGGGEFVLALALADNAHDDGTRIFPAVATMALKSRQSVRAVQGHLRSMQAMGWLQLVREAGGRGRPAEYRINAAWLKGAELAPFTGSVENPGMGAVSAPIPAVKRVQNSTEKGAELDTPYKNRRNLNTPQPPKGGERGEELNPGEGGGDRGFAAVAAGYPRRAGIEAARRVWSDLAPNAALQAEIARAVRAWIPSAEWQRDSGRYVPKLGKFLRDRRWLDAPGAIPAPSAPPPTASVVKLTPEQLQANGAKAREAARLARNVLQRRAA